MPLDRQQKEQTVEAIREQVGDSAAVVVVDSSGTSVREMTSLRAQARQQQLTVQMLPNRLARIALAGTRHEALLDSLQGSSLFVYSKEELSAPARFLKKELEDLESFQVKVISLGSGAMKPEELATVARLPNREEALSRLAGSLKAIPTSLATVLQAMPQKLAMALVAVREQKESST